MNRPTSGDVVPPQWVMRAFPLAQCFNSKVEEYISAKIVKTHIPTRDDQQNKLLNNSSGKITAKKAVVDLSGGDEEDDIAKFRNVTTLGGYLAKPL